MKPISLEVDGYPEFLRSEKQCRSAIERGKLSAETPVVVYGDDGLRERMQAKDHPLLRELLGFSDSLAEAPEAGVLAESVQPAIPAAAAAAVTTGSHRVATSTPDPSARVVQERKPAAYADHAETRNRDDEYSRPSQGYANPPEPSSGQKIIAVLGAGLLFGAVVLGLAQMQSQEAPQVSETESSAAADAAAAAAEAAAAAAEAAAAAQEFYAVRDIQVRSGPERNAAEVVLLPRGASFKGVPTPSASDPQHYWLRITEGQFAGNYVSMTNLATEQRPSLDKSNEGVWFLAEDYVPRAEPSDSAPAKSASEWQLRSGARVVVAGETGGGLFSKPWAEVMLDGAASVGYVPMSMLSREEIGAAADAAAAAAGDATGYRMQFENKCGVELTLLVEYPGPSGLQLQAIRMSPYARGELKRNGEPALTMSDEIYHTRMSQDGSELPDTDIGKAVYFRGQTWHLRKVNTSWDAANERYEASFSC